MLTPRRGRRALGPELMGRHVRRAGVPTATCQALVGVSTCFLPSDAKAMSVTPCMTDSNLRREAVFRAAWSSRSHLIGRTQPEVGGVAAGTLGLPSFLDHRRLTIGREAYVRSHVRERAHLSLNPSAATLTAAT